MERKIQSVQVGQMIMMPVEGRMRRCMVTDVYDFFVRARYKADGKLIDWSFSLGELVQEGYETTGTVFPRKTQRRWI